MLFSGLPQELKEAIVPFCDNETSSALSLVCSCLTDAAQKQVFARTVVKSSDLFDKLWALMETPQGERLSEKIMGEVELWYVTLTPHQLSRFLLVKSLVLNGCVCERWETPLTPPGTFSRLTSLSIIRSYFPMEAAYGLKALEYLALADAHVFAPFVALTKPLPDRARIHTLIFEYSYEAHWAPNFLTRVFDFSCLRTLYTTTRQTVKMVLNEKPIEWHLHNILIHWARNSLETVTLIIEESTVSSGYMYDWELVNYLKRFHLKFTDDSHQLEVPLEVKVKSIQMALDNLHLVSRIRPSNIEYIGLLFEDFYENHDVPHTLPARCNSALDTWKALGDNLLALSKARHGKLQVEVDIHTYREIDENSIPIAPLYNTTDIDNWFATHFISPQDAQEMFMNAAFRVRSYTRYLDDLEELFVPDSV